MKKRRIGILTLLVIATIFGSLFAVGRTRADQTAPDPGSVKFDICMGTVQAPQQNDQPCAVGSVPDEQAYGFGIDCALNNPTVTAAPCQGLFGPGVPGGHTAQSLTITIVFFNPDPTTPFVFNAFVAAPPAAVAAIGPLWNCFGVADFTTGTNNVCPASGAIQPGHCATPGMPSTCVDPSSGAITISTTTVGILPFLSNGGPNVLRLDFLSGNNIQIDNIQAVIAFS